MIKVIAKIPAAPPIAKLPSTLFCAGYLAIFKIYLSSIFVYYNNNDSFVKLTQDKLMNLINIININQSDQGIKQMMMQ